jgi:cyclase
MKPMMKYLSLISALFATAAVAQTPPAEVTIKAETLAPGIAVLFGQGGNIGVSWGEDGTVLIDDQFAPLTPKIQAAVTALGATPVKYLINTHWHGDHTGGNENLGKAGAIIMAQDNVRVRMASPQTRNGKVTGPSPKVALPVITYADGIKLYANGYEIRTVHTGGGHTDGDSLVMWKAANVIHMGDLFMNKVSLPFIDIASGGNVLHLISTLDKALLLTNPQTKIIPGHGPMATQADLIAWRDMIKTVVATVQAGVKAKKTMAQIIAMKPAALYEVKGGFISGDAFVEAVYKSVTAKAGHIH